MPRNSESQTRGAHRRHHTKRGVFSSLCALCRAERPDLGQVVNLEPDTTGLVLEVPKHGEVSSVAIPAPVSFEDQMNNDRLWRYAALRRSIREVSLVYNCTEEELATQVLKSFGTTWDALSERAWLECQYEIESNIYSRAKGNDPRFVLLLDKMQRLSGFASFGNEAARLPVSVQRDLRSMSTEELMKRRADLCRVIDRPRTFDQIGPISPTLELRRMTAEERIPAPVPVRVPTESEIITGSHHLARPSEEVLEKPEPKLEPEPPPPIVTPTRQGPVTYSPPSGMLVL